MSFRVLVACGSSGSPIADAARAIEAELMARRLDG
jgi:hypothetical protein